MKSSLLGRSTVWKCSLCQIFWRLSSVQCPWRVDLKSFTAACCVYLPMYNSLTWLSEWVSHTQTDIPTRLPWWWRFRKTVFSVRCLLRLKKHLNNERGHRAVCKYCGSLSCDFTCLVSVLIVTLEVLYCVWMWTTQGAVARMSWASQCSPQPLMTKADKCLKHWILTAFSRGSSC
jgi:hypothetical protein